MEHVSSVAVCDGNKILMGKRRDSGKWTLPGGGLEPNDSPKTAAIRELQEETGLHVHSVEWIGSDIVQCRDGNPRIIHAFKTTGAHEKPHGRLDPDREVARWQWIDCTNGLPKKVADNMHSLKNVVLQ